MHDACTGVLVFREDATIQHVGPAAPTLLNADRTSLLAGTAEALNRPVVAPEGRSYPSLPAFVDQLLASDTPAQTVRLPETGRADARVTHTDGAPRGVIVTVHAPAEEEATPPTPDPAPSPPDSADDDGSLLRSHHSRLLKKLAHGASLANVLRSIIRFVEEERPSLLGSILLYDPDTETLHHGTAPRLPADYVAAIDGEPVGPAAGPFGSAVYHDETVIVEDITQDERWADYCDLALRHNLRACWSTPIHGADDAVIGSLTLYYETPHTPSDADRALIEEAASLAGLAIEHDRTKRALQLQNDQLRRLVENAQPVVFFLDADGTFLLSEGEDLSALDLEPGEAVGESIYDLYADHPALLDHVNRALGGESVDTTIEVDGAIFDTWYAPYYDSTDTVAGCIGMAVDITDRHEMERQLREQKEWFQSITENIAGGIYRSTDEGLVYANRAFLDLFGYDSLAEMAGLAPAAFYADPDARATLLRQGRDQDGLDGVEVEYRRKDGSTFTGLLRSSTVTNADGSVQYYDGVVTDISEQKDRERKLRAQGEKMEALYQATERLLTAESPAAIAAEIHDLLTEAFDFPLTGVSFVQDDQLVPECVTAAPDYDMPPMRPLPLDGDSLGARALRTQETVVAESLSDTANEISYGDLRAAVCVPMDEHGVLYLGRATAGAFESFDLRLIDVLAKKATAVLDRLEREAALHASEQRFRGLFEEAALGIALMAPDGRIVEANPKLASMLGCGRASLAETSFDDLTGSADRPRDARSFNALLDGPHTRHEFEQRCVRTDGSVFWAHVTVSPYNGPGQARLIATIEDVSERKHYEQQLKTAKQEAEEASRLKSALLANMSHEIRTPLTSIIGFADVLRENLSDQEAEYAQLVHEGGKRLMDTLESVLELSKLEAGVTDPRAESMDLVSLTEETLALYRSQAGSEQITLQFQSDRDVIRGELDPTAVRRILSNLLSNALKFTPDGGTVTVALHAPDDCAVLTVSDTGVGISDAFRDHLFEAFTQESEGLQREHEGSGLGLAIVKRLVDLLNGTIEVESAKGEGTCFTVRLPL